MHPTGMRRGGRPLTPEASPFPGLDRFDSSVGRGDFVTKIGVGQVIKGWDEGVLDMSLGEKSTLMITR